MKRILTIIAILIAVVAAGQLVWQKNRKRIVLYCAHDMVFADVVLKAFAARTGIPVSVRFDTEATKSLGLVEGIIAKADQPECDVFWNNEQLGTMELAKRGLLAVHKGPSWERIPAAFRDAEGRWTGFGARMRVMVENTAAVDAAQRPWSKGAIAKPLYGTTLTHYCALWSKFGGDAVKAWHAGMRKQGVREADGNAMVRRLVADGACAWGYTDTDDVFEALDDGKPVRMAPVRVALSPTVDDGPTVVIPNTVAVLKNAPNPEGARLLADFIASAEAELLLARSGSRQIPLGPVDEAQVPEQVRALRSAAAQGLPLAGLLEVREQVLGWLKQEYAR